MDDHPTQLEDSFGDTDKPLSQECISEFDDIRDALKERLLEAKCRAEEERAMKSLDSILNHVLFAAVVTAFANKVATTQPHFRLYPFHTTLVAGLHEVFHTIENGTFTNGTFLAVFAAPSITAWALQGVIDACLFVSPLVVVAAIFGKWVLGHFTANNGDGQEQPRRRPLHDWSKDARARILSWLDALLNILALSEILYCMCWITGHSPLVGFYIIAAVSVMCAPILYVVYQSKNSV